jgi:CRP-like cAMP-binding protein
MRSLDGSPPELLGFDPLLLAATKELQYPVGRVLFRTGDRPSWLFFILQGQALLQRVTVEGTSVTLQRTNRGFLAEASLTTTAYHCEALCKSECKILAFPLKELRDAIDRHAPTRWAWITLLSTQSRQQRLRIERLALISLRDRLKHLVFTEGTTKGSYEVTSTRAALAGELGVTPAALYRTLASLNAEGIISLSPTTICWNNR